MIQSCLRDSGMKNISQKICNVLKLFLVKHFHHTLNGWLKTLRKHGVMFSLGSGMNITHTFSIFVAMLPPKNSRNQEMFCHWMLENIDQTFQCQYNVLAPKNQPNNLIGWTMVFP